MDENGMRSNEHLWEIFVIFCEFSLRKVDELGVGCEVLNFENSHRIQQKILSTTFTFRNDNLAICKFVS